MRTDGTKGHLDLALLAVLAQQSGHGYEVVSQLRDRSDGAFDLPEGTVYPALHRLELSGYLTSDWVVREGRRRRIYSITPSGKTSLARARRDWKAFARAIDSLLDPAPRISGATV